MREIKNKGEFIKTLKHEIENREFLRNFLNTTYQELLKNFDGKVYNKRFDKALFAELQKANTFAWCECELQSPCNYSNYKENNTVKVIINVRNEKFNYNNFESICTNIVLVRDDNFNLRIDREKSLNERYTKEMFISFDSETECEKDIIKEYDKYLFVAAEMERAVKLYNSLPYRFRRNIDKGYLNIY